MIDVFICALALMTQLQSRSHLILSHLPPESVVKRMDCKPERNGSTYILTLGPYSPSKLEQLFANAKLEPIDSDARELRSISPTKPHVITQSYRGQLVTVSSAASRNRESFLIVSVHEPIPVPWSICKALTSLLEGQEVSEIRCGFMLDTGVGLTLKVGGTISMFRAKLGHIGFVLTPGRLIDTYHLTEGHGHWVVTVSVPLSSDPPVALISCAP